MDIEVLREQLIALNEQSVNIVKTAQSEERDLTDEENDKLEGLDTKYKNTARQIKNIERVQEQAVQLTKGTGRMSDPDEKVQDSAPVSSAQRARFEILESPEVKRNNGFRSFGEFALSVKNATRGTIDPRLLRNAPTTVSTEGVGADGGFAVPPDYRDAIMEEVLGEDSLLSRTDQWTTKSNMIVVPADETTPWATSGGIQAYWTSENDRKSQSKVALKEKTLRLNKLTALIPVTEELQEDAASLDAYLRRRVPEKMTMKINVAIVGGTGAGEPQGILNCGGKVQVSKESGQSADTVVFENITNMYSRMYGPWRREAVWLINQDIEPQLFTMSFEGTSSSVPAYMPAGGLSAAPYATLMGRPVIPTQAAETLGDAGDIIFANMKQYWTGMKSNGVRSETSIHLWFDYDTVAYRFVMRVGGQCWWSAAIDPRDGSNSMGAFITLQART